MGSTLDHAANTGSTDFAQQDGRRSYRCVVYPSNGSYLAECVDLHLIVKAESEERAIESLAEAVIGHVEVAHEMQEPALLYRPSPLRNRLRYLRYGWSVLRENYWASARNAAQALKYPHSFRISA
jgi:hypothetical protein